MHKKPKFNRISFSHFNITQPKLSQHWIYNQSTHFILRMVRGSLWRKRQSLFVGERVLGQRQNAGVFAEMRQIAADIGVQFGSIDVATTRNFVRNATGEMVMVER